MNPLRQQQFRFNRSYIERPPFYRPPRSRPVGFEKPNSLSATPTMSNCPQVHVLIKHNHQHQQQEGIHSNQQQGTMMSTNQLADYNNLPRPYCKQESHRYQVSARSHSATGNYLAQQGQPPRIVINDQQQSSPYPTSTVHKSMLGSRSPINGHSSHNNNSNVAYSRLISPTIMTASYDTLPSSIENYERQPRQLVNAQHQQQASNLISDSDAALSTTFSSPTSLTSRDGNKLAASEYLRANLPHEKTRTAHSNNLGPSASIQANIYSSGANRMARHQSSTILPDTKRDEYMWNRQLERVSIAHQTYRTLPIVLPKPKARHDLASGTYMQHNYDPTWHLVAGGQQSRPSSASNKSRDYEKKIQQAISGSANPMIMADTTSGAPQSNANQRAMAPMAFNYREYIESTRQAY